jgi:hypothetical protein
MLILGCGMAEQYEIIQKVEAFLANSLSFQEFDDWSAEFSWNIHERADSETQALAYQVRAILNAFSEDDSESGLRKELAEAVRPFCSEVRVYAHPVEIVYGKPSQRTAAFRSLVLRSAFVV